MYSHKHDEWVVCVLAFQGSPSQSYKKMTDYKPITTLIYTFTK